MTQLEHAVQGRHQGNRARLEAIEAVSMFVDRFMSLSPTVPKSQLESLLSHPKVLSQVIVYTTQPGRRVLQGVP